MNETDQIGHSESLAEGLFEEDGETLNETSDTLKDSSENAVVKKGRKSSRNTSKNLKIAEHWDFSDDVPTPPTKKLKPDSDEKKTKKRRSGTGDIHSKSGYKEFRVIKKKSDTEMECPECEYRTYSVTGLLDHLRHRHSTTLALAGVALRCECGHECLSEKHSYSCDLANFTVIRKRDGPIRRLEDEKATPQCVLCKVYPSTVCGYINHLRLHHNKSTLRSTGNYLLCACGVKFVREDCRMASDHRKKCDGRDFSIHKLGD